MSVNNFKLQAKGRQFYGCDIIQNFVSTFRSRNLKHTTHCLLYFFTSRDINFTQTYSDGLNNVMTQHQT